MSKNSDKSFYFLILGFFIKSGKKYKAKRLIDNTFEILQKKTNKPLSVLIEIFFHRLRTVVEVKKRVTRKQTHFVLCVISPKRRIYIILK